MARVIPKQNQKQEHHTLSYKKQVLLSFGIFFGLPIGNNVNINMLDKSILVAVLWGVETNELIFMKNGSTYIYKIC